MPGTYSGDPTSSPKDEVRFLIGDTNPAKFDLNDDEILYQLLVVYGDLSKVPSMGNFLAAAYCAEAIGAKYKRLVDKSIGDLHISYSQSWKQYTDLAIRLRSRATIAGVKSFAGGMSRAAKQNVAANSDLITTAVKIDGMDNLLPITGDSDATPPGDNS